MLSGMKRPAMLALIFLIAASAFAQKRAFTIEDFYRVKAVSDLSLSRDGHSLAYVVATPDLPRGKRSSRIWIMGANGGTAPAVTNGDRDSSPTWSPYGNPFAFVRE